MPRLRRYLWFIPVLLALVFGLRRSWSAPPSDFAGYYYGSLALIHGQYAEAYDMRELNDRIAAAGWRNVFVSYAPFPPFTSMVVAPFLVFPMNDAKILFNGVSIVLFLFTLLRLTRYLSTPAWLILVMPVIFFIPLINNLSFGQGYLLLFVLLGEGWLGYQRRQQMLSSLFWATAILFKLFPAFLFLFLLLRRRYRDAMFLGIACTLLLVGSVLINGIESWKFYLSVILPRMNHGELNDSFTYIFQSAFMLFKRSFRYDQLLNPYPLTDNAWLFTLCTTLFKALVLAPAILLTIRAKKEKDDFRSFSVWIAATLLISPNGSSYAHVLLILPLLSLVTDRPVRHSVLAALFLTAACAIPVNRFGTLPIPGQLPRLYLLVLFYLLLIQPLPFKLALPRVPAPSSVLAVFAILTTLFFLFDIRGNLPDKDPSSYVLTREDHLFINDFTARDNHLVYSWRDDHGSHEEQTDYPVHLLSIDSLALINNQIWYKGEQITHSPDQKAKPVLADGRDILYLSDKNRGFEFYTLRKITPAAPPPNAGVTAGVSR